MTSTSKGFRVVDAERWHVEALAGSLRADDAAEVEAIGLAPGAAIGHSFAMSCLCRTMMVGDEVGGMWGLDGSPLGGVGYPWLLTAVAIERAKVGFVKECLHGVATMLTICPRLVGYVDARYARSIRLLGVLGFGLGEPFPIGPYGVPFRQYSLTRDATRRVA